MPVLSFHRSELTQQQLRIAELMREGRTQLEAAEHLKISRQAVSKQVKSMAGKHMPKQNKLGESLSKNG